MKNYWLYFWCRIASIVGNSLQRSIIPIVILEKTKSGGTLGSVLGTQEVLLLITSLIAGYVTDKFNRKYVMVICDLINAALLAIYIVLAKGNINCLFALIFLQNSINKMFFSASGAIFSQIVRNQDLLKRKTLMKTIVRVINISAPPLGIFLYSQWGLNFILLINFLSFLISGILEIFIKYKSHISKKIVKSNIIKEYKKPLTYVYNSDLNFKGLMQFILCINFFFNPLVSIIIPFIITSYLKLPIIYLGYTMSANAIGFIVGGAILSKYPKKFQLGGTLWQQMVKIYFLCIGLAPFSLYLFRNNLILCQVSIIILFFILGFTNVIYIEPLFIYFEIIIPHNIKGRVFSLIETFGALLTPFGYFLVGGIIDKINPFYISIIICSLCSIIYFLVISNKINSKEIKSNLEKAM